MKRKCQTKHQVPFTLYRSLTHNGVRIVVFIALLVLLILFAQF